MSKNLKSAFTGDVTFWREGNQMCVGLSGGGLDHGIRIATSLGGGAGVQLDHLLKLKQVQPLIEHWATKDYTIEVESDCITVRRNTSTGYQAFSISNNGGQLNLHLIGDEPRHAAAYAMAAAALQTMEMMGWKYSGVDSSPQLVSVLAHLVLVGKGAYRVDADYQVLRTLDEEPILVTQYKKRINFALLGQGAGHTSVLAQDVANLHHTIPGDAMIIIKLNSFQDTELDHDDLLNIPGVVLLMPTFQAVRTYASRIKLVDGVFTSTDDCDGLSRPSDDVEVDIMEMAYLASQTHAPAELSDAFAARRGVQKSVRTRAVEALREAGLDHSQVLVALTGAGLAVTLDPKA